MCPLCGHTSCRPSSAPHMCICFSVCVSGTHACVRGTWGEAMHGYAGAGACKSTCAEEGHVQGVRVHAWGWMHGGAHALHFGDSGALWALTPEKISHHCPKPCSYKTGQGKGWTRNPLKCFCSSLGCMHWFSTSSSGGIFLLLIRLCLFWGF